MTLAFNSYATETLVNEAMRSITYSNGASNPPGSVQIDWTFSDGGVSGAGAQTAAGSTTVTINHAPTVSGTPSITGTEDTSYTFQATDFNFADADGDSPQSVKITELPSNGTLIYDPSGAGSTVSTNQTISFADIVAGKLTFVPVAGAAGSSYATFKYQVSDGKVFSADATMTVAVSAVNDGAATVAGGGVAFASLTATPKVGVQVDGTVATLTGRMASPTTAARCISGSRRTTARTGPDLGSSSASGALRRAQPRPENICASWSRSLTIRALCATHLVVAPADRSRQRPDRDIQPIGCNRPGQHRRAG